MDREYAFRILHPKDGQHLPPNFVASGTAPVRTGPLVGLLVGSRATFVIGSTLPTPNPGAWRIYFRLDDERLEEGAEQLTLYVLAATMHGWRLAGRVERLRIMHRRRRAAAKQETPGEFQRLDIEFPGAGDNQHCSALFTPYGYFEHPDTQATHAILSGGAAPIRDDNPFNDPDCGFWSASFAGVPDLASGTYRLDAHGNGKGTDSRSNLDIHSRHCP